MIECDMRMSMTPCVTYVGVGAREGRDLIAVSGRGRARHHHPPGSPWDPTVKKFSPDPNERFLKMSWGPGLGPRSRQKSSPQEIVTVRYFPDFSRPEVFERERTVRKLKIAINQLWREASCPGFKTDPARGSRWKSPVSFDLTPSFLRRSEIRKKSGKTLQLFKVDCKVFCV